MSELDSNGSASPSVSAGGAGASPATAQLSVSTDDEFFEGPDLPPPSPQSASDGALTRLTAELATARAELTALRNADEKRVREERKQIVERVEQLLGTIRQVPALETLASRVRAAMTTNITTAVMCDIYLSAIRALLEGQAKNDSALQTRMRVLENIIAEKQGELDQSSVLLSSIKQDFDRYRTRHETEQEALTVRASEQLLHNVLPVADNLERAIAAAEGATNVDAVLNGVKMIQRIFEDVLAKEGLVPIAALGLPFDPRVHEALMDVQTTEVPEDTVFEEVQRGYYLGSKVFRPAMVKVARRSPRQS